MEHKKSKWNISVQTELIIDFLAILEKSLDQSLFLYNFIREVRSSGVKGSITVMHIRKFFKLHRLIQNLSQGC